MSVILYANYLICFRYIFRLLKQVMHDNATRISIAKTSGIKFFSDFPKIWGRPEHTQICFNLSQTTCFTLHHNFSCLFLVS